VPPGRGPDPKPARYWTNECLWALHQACPPRLAQSPAMYRHATGAAMCRALPSRAATHSMVRRGSLLLVMVAISVLRATAVAQANTNDHPVRAGRRVSSKLWGLARQRSAWLGGSGVNVYSNGSSSGCPSSVYHYVHTGRGQGAAGGGWDPPERVRELPPGDA
jgi:hypothetical protein